MLTTTVPYYPYGQFEVLIQGESDALIECFSITDSYGSRLLVIPTREGAVYISKEQAMSFFGLSDN